MSCISLFSFSENIVVTARAAWAKRLSQLLSLCPVGELLEHRNRSQTINCACRLSRYKTKMLLLHSIKLLVNLIISSSRTYI